MTYLAAGILARSNSVNVDLEQMPVGLDAVIDILLEDLNRFLVSTLLKEAIFAIFFFNVFF